jgi:hypothetical protein
MMCSRTCLLLLSPLVALPPTSLYAQGTWSTPADLTFITPVIPPTGVVSLRSAGSVHVPCAWRS